jgi:hypothetical protein
MFNCKEVSRRVSESMDNELPFLHRAMIHFHLMICRYCRRFKNQLLVLRDACRLEEFPGNNHQDQQGLSPEACERVKQHLNDRMAESKA